MTYVASVLNRTVDLNLAGGTMTPYTMATFQVTDISLLLCFHFWEPVYFLLDEKEQHFPSMTKERRGHFVGIAEHICNKLLVKVFSLIKVLTYSIYRKINKHVHSLFFIEM